jgi:hypothetical protein
MQATSERRRRTPRPAASIALVATLLAAAACAQNPETIAPAPVDEARYVGLHCADLAQEMARLNRELAILSTEQHAKRVNDTVAWTRLFYPAHSARTRDIRPFIALDKGELGAIERTMARRCTGLRS